VFEVIGEPTDWIVDHGKPARVMGAEGCPSYESENRMLVVYDFLRAQADYHGQLYFFPDFYGSACVVSPDDLIPLWHSPEAMWSWRPMVYRLEAFTGCLMYVGSQQELTWRHALGEMMHEMYAGKSSDMEDAIDRAETILREFLNPQQRLELEATNSFRVRGAATRNLYRIKLGHGFEIVSKTTGECLVSCCFHPEGWMPDADVALGIKLMLEDEVLEAQALEAARSTPITLGRKSNKTERYVADLERDLIP